MADYESDTTHLSLMEHGAYRLLLDHYYKKRQALPANASLLHRICRAFAADEQAAVQSVLNEFFVLQSDGYHQKRADREIGKAVEISAKRSAAANAKWRAERELPEEGESQNGHKKAQTSAEKPDKTAPAGDASADASALQVDAHLTTHNSHTHSSEDHNPEKEKDVVRSAKPRSPSRQVKLCDQDYLDELQKSEAYSRLNVRHIHAKMIEYCKNKGKQATRGRLINWLNREDLPMEGNGSGPAAPERVLTVKEKMERERLGIQ